MEFPEVAKVSLDLYSLQEHHFFPEGAQFLKVEGNFAQVLEHLSISDLNPEMGGQMTSPESTNIHGEEMGRNMHGKVEGQPQPNASTLLTFSVENSPWKD